MLNYNSFKDLILGNVNDFTYKDLSDDIVRYDRGIAMAFSIFAFTLTLVMFVVSFFRPEFLSSRNVYLVGMFGSCLIFILSYFGKKHKKLVWIAVYLAETFFLAYGFAIGLFTRVDTQTTTFMVMMILLPIIFVDKPVITNMIVLVFAIVFAIGAYFIKDISVRYVDIIDSLIFGFLSAVSGTTVNAMHIRQFALENEFKTLSEVDQLTGLKNRNSFEWNLQKYANSENDKIACIYIDVNGLHEVNNTEGHKKGDKMLQYIAKHTQKAFSIDHTYRIGGDEYVAFVFDNEVDEIENMILYLNKKIEEAGYHIAVGVAKDNINNINIEKLLRDAEQKMYIQKDIYYSKLRGKKARS